MKVRFSMAGMLEVLAIACGTIGHPAPTNLDDLVKNSPFGAPSATATGVTNDAPLEFRGVLVDGGEYFFSLYDPTTRFSQWVGLNEPGNPFIVHSYDRDKSVAAVEYQGRTLTLTLKQAKVVALAPSAAGAPPVPAGVAPNAAVTSATDDSIRLAAVAEEIRRRRALRAQQAGRPPSAPPPPSDRK